MIEVTEKNKRDELELSSVGVCRKNYSIKAGAGAGKTTMLSKRICRQILDGTPIEEFAVITYTNAAAEELRGKIIDGLSKAMALPENEIDKKEKDRAELAFNSIELMQISTIHAFLLKILREYAFESGITLAAEIREVPEGEDDPKKKEFFDKWYQDKMSDIQKLKKDCEVLSESSGIVFDMTEQILRNMFYDMSEIRDEKVYYDTADHSADYLKLAKDYVVKWLPALKSFMDYLKNNPGHKKDGTALKLAADVERCQGKIEEVDKTIQSAWGINEACLLSEAVGIIVSFAKKGTAYYANDKEMKEDHLKEAKKILSGLLRSDWNLEWDFASLYNKYLSKAQSKARVAEYVEKMCREYKNKVALETQSITNNDILWRAKELITSGKNPVILKKLREKYTKFYVDEFQDTTGIQADIIKSLATDPDTGKFTEDRLVVVGDPKQSIYRFTGAEKAVYDRFDSDMAADDNSESVELKYNFRSNSEIVEWVNDKFSKLMPSGSYQSMNTDWVTSSGNKDKTIHGVYGYAYPTKTVTTKTGKEKTEYADYDDVTAVVDLVKKLTEANIELPHRNPDGTYDTPTVRKVRYSDIMIIFRNATKMTDFAEALAKKGIPADIQGKFEVSGDEVLMNFILLTEYVADYKNKKNRMTAMELHQGVDVTALHKDEIKAEGERLWELRKALREFRKDESKLAPDAPTIVRYLLSREEYYLPKGKEISAERVREYKMRLNRMVEWCLSRNDGDLSNLVELMKKFMKTKIKRLMPLETGENAVRLMNVHQAKGLTGNVVIIADRRSSEACRYGEFRDNSGDDGGYYYPVSTYAYLEKGASQKVIVPVYGSDPDLLRKAYIGEMEESVRLQYVAATRAAHALIIMPRAKRGSSDTWFTDPLYGIYDDKELQIRCIKAEIEKIRSAEQDNEDITEATEDINVNGAVVNTDVSVFSLKNLERILATDKEILDKLGQKSLVSINPSRLEKKGVTGFAPDNKGYSKESRPGGNVFGTVMHRVYELIFMRWNSIKDMADPTPAIERAINQAILESRDDFRRDKDDPAEFKNYLFEKMKVYFELVIKDIMDYAEEVYPEYSFSFFVKGEERETFKQWLGAFLDDKKIEIKETDDQTIWVNGQADLVIVKKVDHRVKVYDYKSDAMNGKLEEDFKDSMKKKYEGQLALYRYAIGKAFGVDPKCVDTELVSLYRE